jgi:uncharacterized protein (DUF1800 family)
MSRRQAFIALNRFGLGARPGELDRVARDPRRWIARQIRQTGDIPAELARLPDAADSIRVFIRARRRGVKAIRRVARTTLKERYIAEINARARAHIRTPEPFRERMVAFWSNHFTVSAKRFFVAPLAGPYEREAIRPHVFGRFEDMLLAVVRHPAMLLYLDNAGSIGPHSIAGRIIRRGLNENLARELLELHTLGVDGGYKQADVGALARILTGWSVEGLGKRQRLSGRYHFVPFAHEPGPKTLLGRRYAEDGEAEGVAALKALARHPATARFIATKLARHFIADTPPRAAIAALQRSYVESGGDLAALARTLVGLEAVWRTPLPKVKTPYEYTISIFRALAVDRVPRRGYHPAFYLLGQLPFAAPSPKGWPDQAADWLSPEALMRRVEFAHTLAQRLPARGLDPLALLQASIGPVAKAKTRTTVARAPSAREALALLFASPEFQRR